MIKQGQLKKGVELCLKNGHGLLQDAHFLEQNNKFTSAIPLFVISYEEMNKALFLEDTRYQGNDISDKEYSNIFSKGSHINKIIFDYEMRKKARADKVWLVIHNNSSEDKALPFIDRVQKQLKKASIKVELARSDRTDLFQTIKVIKDIILKEQENDIFVNVASGSKIQAIACMMACMIFNDTKNVKPFYAHAEEYVGFSGKEQSKGVKKLQELPSYEIQRPKPELIKALKIISEYGKKIPKKILAQKVDDEKLITVNAKDENYEQARFASLDKNIIQPLTDHWKFAEVEKVGRSRYVKITEAGKNAVEFLI